MSDDFLGGMFKPGDAARHTIERELHRQVEAWGYRPGFYYRGPADFVLQHGHYAKARETPPQYEGLRGALTHCFGNALEAALADPDLTYTEGFYMVLGRASEHAWCTAPDGGVVELTFPTDPAVLTNARTPYVQVDVGGRIESDPRGGFATPPPVEKWAYFGVQFSEVEFVRHVFDTSGTTGVLGKPEVGYPVLRQPWTPIMKRLPDKAWPVTP